MAFANFTLSFAPQYHRYFGALPSSVFKYGAYKFRSNFARFMNMREIPKGKLCVTTPRLGIEPGPHWWEASALVTAPFLHPKDN